MTAGRVLKRIHLYDNTLSPLCGYVGPEPVAPNVLGTLCADCAWVEYELTYAGRV